MDKLTVIELGFLLATALCCYLAGRKCTLLIPRERVVARLLLSIILVVVFFPLLFFGFIIGGNFGGAIASHMATGNNYYKSATIFGIGFGIFIVTTISYVIIAIFVYLALKLVKRVDVQRRN